MKYFGTDGIRDRVDGPNLASPFLNGVGIAVGKYLRSKNPGKSIHVVIGRDTRESGERIFIDLARGLEKEKIRIFDAGIIPTPGVAESVRELDLDFGIVITASHNPASDNGIKFFSPGGYKLPEEEESILEDFIDKVTETTLPQNFPPSVFLFDGKRHFLSARKNVLPENALLGLRIVVDSSHGATHQTTPEILHQLGACVLSIGNNPNGTNINQGVGSEETELLCQKVCQEDAHLGIAHDGDGDRLILCDDRGNVVDGDAILAILGTAWAQDGRLQNNTVVATVMSNLGLDRCLDSVGASLLKTNVGDRNVFYKMKEVGSVLGGESSGHFIALNYAPTGDGLLAALLVLEQLVKTNKTLRELASIFEPFPQAKINLPVREKKALESCTALQKAQEQVNQNLKDRGRILIRYSGTESKIRLLVEADDTDLANDNLAILKEAVSQDLQS